MRQRFRSALRDLLSNNQGQDYVLVVAMLASVAAAGMTAIAIKINQVFAALGERLSSYTS